MTFLVPSDLQSRSKTSTEVAVQGWKGKAWLNKFFRSRNQTIRVELRLTNEIQETC